MLGYLVACITRYFGDTIGVPAALAITGLLILVLAAVAAHLFPDDKGSAPTGWHR